MVRIVGGAATGYVLIGLLVVLTDRLFALLTIPLTYYFAITLATDCMWTVLGGFACSKLSYGSRKAVFGLMIFGEIMGILSAFLAWSTQPHWFAIALLVLYPVAIWVGYKLSGTADAATLPT